jgi:3-mercaptopyruvate sulfurtransferase SseA
MGLDQFWKTPGILLDAWELGMQDKTSKCLPAPWIWTAEGSYKDVAELRAIASGVTDKNLAREIIVYCGVGGYASAWWFVLARLLTYENVKIYGGSAQEWTRDPAMPLSILRWD